MGFSRRGCVARTDAQHRLRENSATSCTLPPGAAQSACPGYGNADRRGMRSPDRCAASPPGKFCNILHASPGGGAKRLPGLRDRRPPGTSSPDRCAASPPGKFCNILHASPQGRRKASCPGYGTADRRGCVARTDAQHRLRENSATSCTLPPGAAQSALPGLRDRRPPVARIRR